MTRTVARDVEVAPFAAADVLVRVDKGGRLVFVVPDDVARALRQAGKAGWVEVLDMGDGEGAHYAIGTRVHAAATILIDVARALPDDELIDAELREGTESAARFGAVRAFVVGGGAWDEGARCWADYDDTVDLHTAGSLNTSFVDGSVYWAG